MMKRLIKSVLVATAAMAFSQVAEGGMTYHWKGTELVRNWPISQYEKVNCAFWTNANNWVEGVVPGQYYDPSGALVGDADATVEFGAMPDGGQGRVIIQGLYTVSNVVFTSGCPYYYIGGTLDRSLEMFRPYSHGGRIIVEAGATTPRFRAVACSSDTGNNINNMPSWSTARPYPTFVNNGNEALVIDNFGTLGQAGATWGAGGYAIGFGGNAEIAITAMGQRYHVLKLMLHQMTGGKLTFNCAVSTSTTDYWIQSVAAKADNATGELCLNGQAYAGQIGTPLFDVGGANSMLKVTGTGTLTVPYGNKSNGTPISESLSVAAGSVLRIECPLAGQVANAGLQAVSGAGTVEIVGGSALTGSLDLLSSANGFTLKTDEIGTGGPTDALGTSSLRMANGARLLYTGNGETCTRPITLHNKRYGVSADPDTAASPQAIVEQVGTGALVVESPITVTGGAGTLTLGNKTAQMATWKGVLADTPEGGTLGVAKTGDGTWTLSGVNTYSGLTTIRSGTLELANAAALGNTSGIVVDTARATLKIADGVAIPAVAFAQSGAGALDVQLGVDASIKVKNAADGHAPLWLTLNGERAAIAADGTLVTGPTTVWKTAASGDWSTADNWNNGVPTVSTEAQIDLPGDYTVSVTVPASVAVVNQQAGTLAVSASMTVSDGVVVGTGAIFNMADGSLTLDSGAAQMGEFKLDGGTANFSGGVLNINRFYGFTGGGMLNINGTATAEASADNPDARFAADAGKTLAVSITGSKSYVRAQSGAFALGGKKGGVTKMTITRDGNYAVSSANVGKTFSIGDGNGYAELTCNHQYGYIGTGNGGMSVGYAHNLGEASCPTGVLVIAGHSVISQGVGFWWDDVFGGLAVGNGLYVSEEYDSHAVGRVEFTTHPKSTLSVSGAMCIGLGRASGEIVQNGGSFTYNGQSRKDASSRWGYHPLVLGYAGGDGIYVISNGTAKVSNGAICIGGCQKKDLDREQLQESYVKAGGRNSVGRLCARGGTFVQVDARGVILGADGEGCLEIGPAGSFSTPSLVVSNQCAGVLAFELGTDGAAGLLSVTNLTIAAGAKIVIDARHVSHPRMWTKLADLGAAAVGAFDSADVTILASGKAAERLAGATVLTARDEIPGLWLKRQDVGMTVIVR